MLITFGELHLDENLILIWEDYMRNMQCNVKFRHQLSVFSSTEENHGEP